VAVGADGVDKFSGLVKPGLVSFERIYKPIDKIKRKN